MNWFKISPRNLRSAFFILFLLPLVILAAFFIFRLVPPPAVSLTSEERDWLERHAPSLALYYNTDFPPLEFAGENGEFSGLGADVSAEVEKRLGITLRRVPCPDWNEHLAALESGACAVAPTIVRSPEREQYAFFTTPYASSPVVIITGAARRGELSLDDLAGLNVAVVSGFVTEKYVKDYAQGRFTVTAMKNVQEALRELVFGRVDALVENIAVASYYSQQEGIANLRVAGNTDLSFVWSMAVSRNYPLLFSSLQKGLASIPPADLEALQNRWIRFEPGRGLSPQDWRNLKLAGLFVVLLVACLLVITYFLKRRLKEKVANLRTTQQELRESWTRLRALSDNLPGGLVYQVEVITDDPGRRFSYISAGVQGLHELTPAQVLGDASLLYDQIETEDRFRVTELEERALAALAPFRAEIRFRLPSGQLRWGLMTSSPRRLAEGKLVWDGIEIDITEQKSSEEERNRMQQQLQHARKMESVGTLAGGIAHDFNNILQAIGGAAQLMLATKKEVDQDCKSLLMINKAVERAGLLIRQLMAFSRKVEGRKVPLALNREVLETNKILQQVLPRMITIELDLDPGLWPVEADPVLIQQMLLNLGNNAADAMPDGGRLHIATSNLEDSLSGEQASLDLPVGRWVRLLVSDTGCGMSPEIREKIFDPFFTTKEIGKGTGLGLASVYGIVHAHGGRVFCDSEPGRGTDFMVFLPALAGPAAETVEERSLLENLSGCETVLVVDDESEIREITVELLERFGYQVIPAASGEEALDLYASRGAEIDLVILDLNMPGMGGRACLRKLLERDLEIKILIASGCSADARDLESGGRSGAAAFIGKPYLSNELLGLVRRILDQDNP